MSEKHAKRQRRHQRQTSQPASNPSAGATTTSSSSGGDVPPHASTVFPHPSPASDPFAASLLAVSLQTAVPLRILACYERGGPTEDDLMRARHFGSILAERGDRLLYRSEHEGETADLFNQLAESIATLSFVPGGIPSLFGQRFDAQAVLSGIFGPEKAQDYCARIRQHHSDASGS